MICPNCERQASGLSRVYDDLYWCEVCVTDYEIGMLEASIDRDREELIKLVRRRQRLASEEE